MKPSPLAYLMAAAFVAGCIATSGCTAVHAAQLLPTDPVARYEPPSIVIPEPEPGDCADVVGLGPGQARACASVSVPWSLWVAMQALEDQCRVITEPALVSCYDGRDADRADAAAVIDDVAVDCRIRARQAFAAGVAVGAGSCGLVVGAVGTATR